MYTKVRHIIYIYNIYIYKTRIKSLMSILLFKRPNTCTQPSILHLIPMDHREYVEEASVPVLADLWSVLHF